MVSKMTKFSKKINIKVKHILNKRIQLRHRINHETDRSSICIRRGYYDPTCECIVFRDPDDPTRGYLYDTPTSFCNDHYLQKRSDRVINCNGWRELEAFIEGEWVSLMDLRSKFIQAKQNKASNIA